MGAPHADATPKARGMHHGVEGKGVSQRRVRRYPDAKRQCRGSVGPHRDTSNGGPGDRDGSPTRSTRR
eukprot:5257920-Heterocapsa_arctica.AAC.1